MQRFGNVLVGVDLSNADRLAASDLTAPSLEAIERGIWLAERSGAMLTFFSAIEITSRALQLLAEESGAAEDLVGAITGNVETAGKAVLKELEQRAEQRGVQATSKLVFGKDWLEIVRQVIREDHDLVIVGTRKLKRRQQMLFGSTGINLLRNCPCPVWITKPGPQPEIANVLVCSDLSEVSLDALEIVISGGQWVDAKIHLLHAVEYPLERRLAMTGMGEDEISAYRANIRADAEAELHEQLSRTDYRTLSLGVQVHVVDGRPEIAVIDALEEHEVDLLVMGTVARGGIPGLLVGNTAERILSEVPCSLLAVKPDDFVCPVTVDS